jgi:hypothetical protein
MLEVLIAESVNLSLDSLLGAGGVTVGGGVLVYIGSQIGRIATRISGLVEAETKRREAEDKHRQQQRRHWRVEEALFHRMAGVPGQIEVDVTPEPVDVRELESI